MQQAYNKPALTIQQQIAQLQQRGMIINDIAAATHYLGYINYYRLSAYWLIFESDHVTHTFRQGTTFEQVFNLYIFDRELRLLVLDAIERIEVAIRSQFSHQLSHQYGAHPHLISALFKASWDYAHNFSQLQKDAKASKESFAQHLLAKYTEPLPPIWATVEIMTLGQLSKWYANLQSGADRNQIAHLFDFDEVNLVSFLHHITTIRNHCAHHSRLWNREFIFTFKLPRKRPDVLLGSYNQLAPRHIYNTLATLAYIMNQIAPGHHWRDRLKNTIHQHQIREVSMEVSMGFPVDWKTRSIWQ